ncbi:MAG TPA: hypothetical protein VKM93_03760 [Terriglobia bacterium]|nr:hypothetical protein [Terriglobia bacterium]
MTPPSYPINTEGGIKPPWYPINTDGGVKPPWYLINTEGGVKPPHSKALRASSVGREFDSLVWTVE